MYLRATRVQTPPDKLKEAIHNFETNILPAVRKAPGNAGAVLLVNRETGAGIGITYWESAKAMGASEQVGIDSRTQTVKNVPGTQIVNVERAELVLVDRAATPKAGSFTRVVTGQGDPEKVDAGINLLRTKILPIAKAQKGYRASLASVDRLTGRVSTSTVWDTLDDLQASDSKISGARAEVAEAGGLVPETMKIEIFETAVVELSAAAAEMASRA